MLNISFYLCCLFRRGCWRLVYLW